MNLIDAVKSGRPVAYEETLSYQSDFTGATTYIAPRTFMTADYLLSLKALTPQLIVSDKWLVKEPEVRITRGQLDSAVLEAKEWFDLYPPAQKTKAVGDDDVTWRDFAQEVAKRLGLENP